MVIVVCGKSSRFARLVGKKDPVATLATLVLLSYAKFLYIIIASFSNTVLQYPTSDGAKPTTVWLPNANVKYLRGKHIVLFIMSLLILIAGIVYTSLQKASCKPIGMKSFENQVCVNHYYHDCVL